MAYLIDYKQRKKDRSFRSPLTNQPMNAETESEKPYIFIDQEDFYNYLADMYDDRE